MAVDKLVDSTQLDSDLGSIADAIRAKGGTSALLVFPSDFITAIGNISTGGTPRTSDDLEVSGATVTAPAGTYASAASKSVASGTAGTPTASKGTVSNHSISVTPSVTNTTGYITGGTKTGTAVSVSASELVSGTYSVTSSGTKDVTNYASASVPAGTEGTPTATKGTVNNHSVSVTPSVTNSGGYITGSTKTGTAVTVSASELVSGSETKTSNGTYDVTNLAQLIVNVAGGGGSTNVVTGSFTTSATTGAAQTVDIPYTGSGHPNLIAIYPSDGFCSGSSLYGITHQYATIQIEIFRADPSQAATYNGTGTINNGYVSLLYKGSSSTNTTASRANGASVFTSSAATASTGESVRMSSNKKMSIFVSSNSYGFLASTTYNYVIVYSS